MSAFRNKLNPVVNTTLCFCFVLPQKLVLLRKARLTRNQLQLSIKFCIVFALKLRSTEARTQLLRMNTRRQISRARPRAHREGLLFKFGNIKRGGGSMSPGKGARAFGVSGRNGTRVHGINRNVKFEFQLGENSPLARSCQNQIPAAARHGVRGSPKNVNTELNYLLLLFQTWHQSAL